MLTRLVLIRHGETDWNAQGRWQGRQDVPLNARGLEQARRMAAYVAAEFNIRVAWSSDLGRCAATAGLLGVPVRTSRTLREIGYGRWEGKRFADLPREEQDLVAGQQGLEPDFRAPGGETRKNLVRRARRFLSESGVLMEEGDVAIVSHGGLLRGLLTALLGLPPRAMGRFHFDNASVSVVEADGDLVTLTALNITAHLNSSGRHGGAS